MALLAAPASAGGGTGITATPAATVAFDGGAYSAKFVRSASGIINETNRVEVGVTSGNGFGPFDVWLQFRPLTGPSGTGSPTPNSACGSNTVVAPFAYVNTDPAITGTPTSGYFIGSNPYEVCVYYTQSFALTLLANGASSTTVYVGDHVIYTGQYTYGTTPNVGYPVTLNVWTGVGCSGTPLYTGISAGVTDASGMYSLDGGPSPLGVYSIMGMTSSPAITSNCVNVTVLPNNAATLFADGVTTYNTVVGDQIDYTGTFTYNGVGVSGLPVDMNIYSSPGCTGLYYAEGVVATTDLSGNFTWDSASTVTAPAGSFYLQVSSGAYLSNCINVNVS
jgi:hypothetical protein